MYVTVLRTRSVLGDYVFRFILLLSFLFFMRFFYLLSRHMDRRVNCISRIIDETESQQFSRFTLFTTLLRLRLQRFLTL